MRYFLSALKFITILPGGRGEEFEPGRMAAWFPAVGLFLGALVAAFDRFALHLWSRPLASLLDVLLLVVLTGAFHLDGLGDAADGLFSHRSRERMLQIMKDSRLGTMGLIAVVAAMSLKWAALAELDGPERSLLIFLIPGFGRAGILPAMRWLSYARPEGGTGKGFFERDMKAGAFWGLLPLVGLSLFLGAGALLLVLAWALCVAAIIGFYRRRINGVTGDMLGAMVEAVETALFVLAAAGLF